MHFSKPLQSIDWPPGHRNLPWKYAFGSSVPTQGWNDQSSKQGIRIPSSKYQGMTVSHSASGRICTSTASPHYPVG